MTGDAPDLELSRCDDCQLRYLPTDGPCPRCGSRRPTPYSVPAAGTVLVATELHSPSEGWTAPHRLAFVEVADKVRLLAIVDGRLPTTGAAVRVVRDGIVYRATVP